MSKSLSSAKKAKKEWKVYTLEEVAKHDQPNDLWLVIDGKVLDTTKYYPHHPGGTIMHTWAGRDASDPFTAWHTDEIRKKAYKYQIGVLEPQKLSKFDKEKAELVRRVEELRLYDTDWGYYKIKLAVPLLFLLGSLLCQFSENFYIHSVLSCLLLSLCWHQCAWIGHDTMHNAIFETIRDNHKLGLIYGNLLTGISGGWWKYTHNMHHATVNEWERDPDITHLPVFAVTEKMFLHKEAKKLTPWEESALRVLIPLQHVLYLPIMLVARFNLYFQGVYLLVAGKVLTMPYQKFSFPRDLIIGEYITLAGFWMWYGALVRFIWTTYGGYDAFWFVMIGHLYMGVLHVQITLSHWERPMATKNEGNQDWFFNQVETARNIDSNIFNDWYYGGLHYQIEHHLFPRVPRHNLAKLKKLVVPFCHRNRVPYLSTGFFHAAFDVIKSLSDVAHQVEMYEEYRKHRNAHAKLADE